ncbi:helix-turn-helix domain-containing protein [Novispirillum sp. DQ9]|uniref:helix-turn-helix domain-containing protein n=1 Tax=Novispirillum sp. DQ9 TaxID=3398612 RepID=UPI003C7B1AA9
MKLADYMKVHGLGPSEMARRLKVSHATVSRYRDGDRVPEPDVMRRIVEETGGAVLPNDFYDLPSDPEADRPAA